MNVLNQSELKDVFAELEGWENRWRRYKAFKELDIYNQNQARYIHQSLSSLYGGDILKRVQPESSINLATRIVNAEASIYKRPAQRVFTGTDAEIEAAETHYKYMNVDEKMKISNRLYRLGQQNFIQIVPQGGKLKTRVLYKHQFDVVPYADDPEKAEVVIIPLQVKPLEQQELMLTKSDGINQKIGDVNDTDLSKNRYVVWTEKYNFMCDGNGTILDPITFLPKLNFTEEELLNPIQTLPFIDVSSDKLMGFWAGYGSSLTDFSVSFGVTLTDLGEIVKLQGYSQGVISSLEEPKEINVGPHRIVWLKKDKNLEGDKDPKFEFVSPSPDIQGSLQFVHDKLRLMLSSRGLDTKTVTSQQTSDYASGIERLLAMVDRAEATAEDRVLFARVEQEYFELLKKWNNYLQGTQDTAPEASIAIMSDEMSLTTKFDQPMEVQTKEQKEQSAQRRMDMGLLSRKKAAIELYEISDEQAEEMILEIDQEEGLTPSNSSEDGLVG